MLGRFVVVSTLGVVKGVIEKPFDPQHRGLTIHAAGSSRGGPLSPFHSPSIWSSGESSNWSSSTSAWSSPNKSPAGRSITSASSSSGSVDWSHLTAVDAHGRVALASGANWGPLSSVPGSHGLCGSPTDLSFLRQGVLSSQEKASPLCSEIWRCASPVAASFPHMLPSENDLSREVTCADLKEQEEHLAGTDTKDIDEIGHQPDMATEAATVYCAWRDYDGDADGDAKAEKDAVLKDASKDCEPIVHKVLDVLRLRTNALQDEGVSRGDLVIAFFEAWNREALNLGNDAAVVDRSAFVRAVESCRK
jgi:hypothetical protein